MTLAELTVSFCCLAGGYLLVGALLQGKSRHRATRSAIPNSPVSPQPETLRPDTVRIDRTATLSNWYRILGVDEAASREQIVAAYKKLIGQYHPDKVAQMGEEIRAVAEAKSKQINAAYEIGMRLFR